MKQVKKGVKSNARKTERDTKCINLFGLKFQRRKNVKTTEEPKYLKMYQEILKEMQRPLKFGFCLDDFKHYRNCHGVQSEETMKKRIESAWARSLQFVEEKEDNEDRMYDIEREQPPGVTYRNLIDSNEEYRRLFIRNFQIIVDTYLITKDEHGMSYLIAKNND